MNEQPKPKPKLWPVAAVGVAMVSFILIKTGRDAIFFSQDESLRSLPLAYIWIGLAAIPAALLHMRLMRRLGSRLARVVLFAGAGLLTSLFVPLLNPQATLVMDVFFVFVPVLFAAVFASAWLLAGDLLEGAEAELRRRTYAWVGGASTLGGVLGGALAKLLALVVAPRMLVLAGALVLLLAAWIARRAHRANPIAPASELAEPRAVVTARALVGKPLVRLLASVSALAAIAGLLIEFQFYAVSTLTGSVSSNYFANFYMLVSAVAFVLQVSVAPVLQGRIGVAGTLLVMPVALFGASATLVLTATLLGRAALKATENGLKSAIHRTAWEQAFLPLSREARARAKAMVDGGAARVAEGVTALLLYLWMVLGDVDVPGLTWLALGTAAVVLAWIALTVRMRKCGLDDGPGVPVEARLSDGCPIASAFGAACPKERSQPK